MPAVPEVMDGSVVSQAIEHVRPPHSPSPCARMPSPCLPPSLAPSCTQRELTTPPLAPTTTPLSRPIDARAAQCRECQKCALPAQQVPGGAPQGPHRPDGARHGLGAPEAAAGGRPRPPSATVQCGRRRWRSSPPQAPWPQPCLLGPVPAAGAPSQAAQPASSPSAPRIGLVMACPAVLMEGSQLRRGELTPPPDRQHRGRRPRRTLTPSSKWRRSWRRGTSAGRRCVPGRIVGQGQRRQLGTATLAPPHHNHNHRHHHSLTAQPPPPTQGRVSARRRRCRHGGPRHRGALLPAERALAGAGHQGDAAAQDGGLRLVRGQLPGDHPHPPTPLAQARRCLYL